MRNILRTVNDYGGTIKNRENVGLTTAEIVAKWNALHPEDPVEE
jgi:hypothetical protein